MNFLLLDTYDQTGFDFVLKRIKVPLVPVRPPKSPGGLIIQWLLGIVKVLHISRRHDTIVCVYDFQAVLSWWICYLFGWKRQFLALNLLLDLHPGLKNRWVANMYRRALRSQNFSATVTSAEYGSWLNDSLGLSVSYTLLRDVYHPVYEVSPWPVRTDVFCGGRNGRDWDFLILIAKEMPDISFTAVMPPKEYSRFAADVPGNVTLLTNISFAEFAGRLSASSVVCLPLYKQAPAGLIVLFQAAANRKPVMISSTVTTREYLEGGRGCLLGRDLQEWVKAVRWSLSHQEESAKTASRLLRFCEEECSRDKYLDILQKLLTTVPRAPQTRKS